MVAVSMEGVVELAELNVVEQRYQAVLEVLNDGASVTDVARRYEVSRQTVHVWLRNYANEGLAGLVDGSARPLWCPHQMSPEVEARVVELRRQHPGWVRDRSAINSPEMVWFRCRAGRRFIGVWFVTG